MRRVSGFWSLSTEEKARVVVAAVLLLALPGALTIASFSRVRSVLVRAVDVLGGRLSAAPAPERIAQSVMTCDRHLPGTRTCLVRSMTTEALLRLYGYSPEHRIGVRRDEETDVAAHSWIEYDGEVLIGDLEDLSRFNPFPPIEWDSDP